MAGIALAIVGSTVIGSAMQSSAARKAASTAAAAQESAAGEASQAQLEATRLGIEEQRRQFDAIQALFRPYIDAGGGALARQLDLIGIGGADRQQEAIRAIEMGPEFASMVRQGEEGILQNAAATGGLRGGNVQQALAKFRPEVLSSLLNQQYSRLGGISALGQNSAAGQAAQGQAFGANMANLYNQQGQSLANLATQRGDIAGQLALARGQATSNMWGNIAGSIGTLGMMGAYGMGPFAPKPPAPPPTQAPFPAPFRPG